MVDKYVSNIAALEHLLTGLGRYEVLSEFDA